MRIGQGGLSSLPTIAGLIFTLFLLSLTMAYSVRKFDQMITRKEVDIISVVQDSYFDEAELFSYKQGFNIAVALDSFEPIDPSYGRISFSSISYENMLSKRFEMAKSDEKSGLPLRTKNKIESHVCTPEELGIVEGDSPATFKPIHKSSKNSFEALA